MIRSIDYSNDRLIDCSGIVFEDDKRVRRALSVASDIEFYRYEVGFKLRKGL